MLCSECKKNTAVVFINKVENGVSSMEGLCRDCAKKRGLDVPEAPQNSTNNNASNQQTNNIDMTNMSKQLESLFKDLSSSLKKNIDDLK